MINDKYIIKNIIGKGRSKVFLCEDKDNNNTIYALKILPSNAGEQEKQSFRKEYFAGMFLNHPNIIKCFQLGNVQKTDFLDYNIYSDEVELDSNFIQMEYFDGKNLNYYQDKLDENNLLLILEQICSALFYLHKSNYVFFDLKPENILISFKNRKPEVKIIDLGFILNLNEKDNYYPRGTAEYIAPELIKNEPFDHRIDLYSLGIIMYKLLYKKFPFSSDEINIIYKEQVERRFDFPETNYPEVFLDFTKKLLVKQPSNRFKNTAEAFQFLINRKLDVRYWNLPVVFSGRFELIKKLISFTNNQEKKVLLIKGSEASGKSALLKYISFSSSNAFIIEKIKDKQGLEFFRNVLKRLLYNENFVKRINIELLDELRLKLNNQCSLDDIKYIFSSLSGKGLLLLIDDFNLYDDFTQSILKELTPFLLINQYKLIVAEDSNNSSSIESFDDSVELGSFNEKEVEALLNELFIDNEFKNNLRNIIINYSDLLPGNIINYIKDLFLLEGICLSEDYNLTINNNIDKEYLSNLQSNIYKERISKLNKKEFEAAKIISSFDIDINEEIIKNLLNLEPSDIEQILFNLKSKNIINYSEDRNQLQIASLNFKKHIYSLIEDVKYWHLFILTVLKNDNKLNRIELARHYEIAENYNISYDIYFEELKKADSLFAFNYKKKLIEHLRQLPLEAKLKIEVDYQYARTLYSLGDFLECFNKADELLLNSNAAPYFKELKILKGNCLINLSKNQDAKEELKQVLPLTESERERNRVLMDLATIEFNVFNHDAAESLCKRIINSDKASNKEKGRAYNLYGLINVSKDKDFKAALDNFLEAEKIFQQDNLMAKTAEMQMNIGNIYNIQGNNEKVEYYWNKSLNTNKKIGNLKQEANIYMNFGIYYFEKSLYENALENYHNSLSIFINIGNKEGEGLALTNLGECYTIICEYEKALVCFESANKIFVEIDYQEELAEVLFLYGKLLLLIGCQDKFDNIIKDCEVIANKNKSERTKANLNFLRIFQKEKIHGSDIILIEEANALYLKQDDAMNFVLSSIFLSRIYASKNNDKKGLQYLVNDNITDVINNNKLLTALWNYYMGLIAESFPEEKLESPFHYYNEALNIIDDFSINELTWMILYRLILNYDKRGNTSKVKELNVYFIPLIKYIVDKIKDDSLREVFFNNGFRKEAFSEVLKFYN
ncbi:MAG TPA: protein kinase [Ignavibacteriaceae bacterium]|nr:protein kinase [Ignavibacteriaceae bacterium]